MFRALAIGPYTLTLTATNANGETTSVTTSLIHSHMPVHRNGLRC